MESRKELNLNQLPSDDEQTFQEKFPQTETIKDIHLDKTCAEMEYANHITPTTKVKVENEMNPVARTEWNLNYPHQAFQTLTNDRALEAGPSYPTKAVGIARALWTKSSIVQHNKKIRRGSSSRDHKSPVKIAAKPPAMPLIHTQPFYKQQQLYAQPFHLQQFYAQPVQLQQLSVQTFQQQQQQQHPSSSAAKAEPTRVRDHRFENIKPIGNTEHPHPEATISIPCQPYCPYLHNKSARLENHDIFGFSNKKKNKSKKTLMKKRDHCDCLSLSVKSLQRISGRVRVVNTLHRLSSRHWWRSERG